MRSPRTPHNDPIDSIKCMSAPQSSNPTHSPRLIAPDLARGLALLGIAIANITTAWAVTQPTDASIGTAWFLGGYSPNPSLNATDSFLMLVTSMTTHNRGLPMFATLLGVGVGLLAISQWRRNIPLPQARKNLSRRYLALALIGLVHIVFLFHGDILLTYGLSALVLIALLAARDKTIKILTTLLFIISGAIGVLITSGFGLLTLLSNAPNLTTAERDALQADMSALHEMFLPAHTDTQTIPEFLQSNVIMLGLTLANLPMFLISYLPLMLIGFLWVRQGVFHDPAQHQRRLWAWLIVGIVLAVLLGLPMGLIAIGVWDPTWGLTAILANALLGHFTGPGILAGVILLCHRWYPTSTEPATPALPVRMLVALGKRSLSGYLAQSVLFAALFYPFLLGVPHQLGTTVLVAIAVAVWAVTLLGAWWLEKTGRKGPAEWLHRRLAYGKQP